MIPINSLWVSQESLRNPDQIPSMIDHVTNGGFWSIRALTEFNPKENNLIVITELTDAPKPVLLIHDGHHRILATLLAGRQFLHCDEYIFVHKEITDYKDINFNIGWVTPFCPITEVRLPDFYDYKDEVMTLTDRHTARTFIHNNKHRYAKPRTMITPLEVARAAGFP